MDDSVKLLNGIIAVAEATAGQATGNDQDDWNVFADGLRKLRDEIEATIPEPTPHK